MTRQKILTDLFKSPEVNECIGKMNPPHLREDLKAELFAVLCELPEEKIVGLAERNELRFFCVRIILNMIQSNTSPFFKKFRTVTEDLDPRFHDEEQEDAHEMEILFETRLKDVERVLNTFHWYDTELFRIYVREGSIRKVEALVNIPRASIHNTIKKVRKAILEQLC